MSHKERTSGEASTVYWRFQAHAGKPGHCPGKILINCGYCLRKLVVAPLCVLPAQVTLQL